MFLVRVKTVAEGKSLKTFGLKPNMKYGLWSFPAKGGVAKLNFSVSKGVINWPIKCLDNKCRCLTNKSDSHDLYVGKHQDYLL